MNTEPLTKRRSALLDKVNNRPYHLQSAFWNKANGDASVNLRGLKELEWTEEYLAIAESVYRDLFSPKARTRTHVWPA